MTDRQREDPIEERLLDEGETGQQAIVDAAAEGFERDQEDPDSPTRRKRSSGVYDPSHSRGSTAAGPGPSRDERS
jgi:hypothetical protein